METKVVNFPKAKSARGPKTDADLTADVRRAWRKLARTIRAAQNAGLDVDSEFYEQGRLHITRKL